MKTKITDILGKKMLFFDGAMGTMLQNKGMKNGEIPELMNISASALIEKIHCEYLDAGADIITTNTFGANPLKAEAMHTAPEIIIAAAIENAKKAVKSCRSADKPRFVAFDIGPTGMLMEPMGDLSFDECYKNYAGIAVSAEKFGADLAIIETMSDTLEMKAALLAVKENTDLPVFCTMTFDETHKTLTGADVRVMAAMLEGLGADCIGINCGLGPAQIYEIMKELAEVASIPIMAQPNAGLPQIRGGKTVYDVFPAEFAEYAEKMAQLGTSVLGGCCGTTPEYIAETVRRCEKYTPKITEKDLTVVASYSKAVFLDERPVIIGERINPTGKKKFKEALKNGDINYIINEAFSERDNGAHILDVNVGLPEIDECAMMEKAVKAITSAVNLPLQIDSSDPVTMERALRIYNGKALVNSVNGKKESMDAVFPLVKKYGGTVIGLCLDENGIPPTAEGRRAVASKIVNTAAEYGIKKKDIIIDALTLTISAQQKESIETVKAIRLIKEDPGVKTVLGVSNISFGLPRRELINGTFFAMALSAGLDACIINPSSEMMMNTYRAYRALCGADGNCSEYIAEYTGTVAAGEIKKVQSGPAEIFRGKSGLYTTIIKGLRDSSYAEAAEMLKTAKPMDIINNEIIPALDYVGAEFEKGKMFLPQLMMSAETVRNAFDAVKEEIKKSGKESEIKGRIVLCTVKGDIHDIGKNIVKVLLENYGYDVLDLGKDVPSETVVDALIKNDIHMCGLSALMTTTVANMADTIKAVRIAAPDVKIMVGGAVMTKEYADMIGADAYCKDALAAVNYANNVFAEKNG